MTLPIERTSPAPRGRVGQIPIDLVTFAEALSAITRLVEAGRGGFVLTPNVDHVVLADRDERLRGAYAEASLSVADGMPVVWASRALGEPAPEKISGSDLVGPLMQIAATRGFRVYLLGGGEDVAKRAADNLQKLHPGLVIAGVSSPHIHVADPRSRRSTAEQTARRDPSIDRRAVRGDREGVLDAVRRTSPDLILVGLGCPKQELWIHESMDALRPAVLLGVGASLDFLAGTMRRAPAWMSRAGLEWSYRLAMEPRRMWQRYLLRDPEFVRIFLADWMGRSGARGLRT